MQICASCEYGSKKKIQERASDDSLEERASVTPEERESIRYPGGEGIRYPGGEDIRYPRTSYRWL